MTKTILVTGSNGLLGQKLIELISLKKEFRLIATARGQNRIPENINYTFHSLDISDKVAVDSAFEYYKPNIVIHTAAMTNVDQCELEMENCWAQNVIATRNAAEASKNIGAHLIHLSTDFIFDGSKGSLTEEEKPSPISFYGYSKLAAEQLVINMEGLKWSICRTVLVYGIANDMSRSNIILWVKKSLEEKKNIKIVDDQWRTPTLAEDLAMGCLLVAEKEEFGIFNIAGKDYLNPYQMAMKVVEYFKLDASFITLANSSTFSQPAKRPLKTGFVIDKAKQKLGYTPKSFDEGIAILAQQLSK